MNRRAIMATVGSVSLVVASTIDHRPRWVWNASASAPVGLYAAWSPRLPTVGSKVLYAPPPSQAETFAARRYLPNGVPLLKTVAAIAPSEVCRQGKSVTVEGVVVARALSADKIGRPLPAWSGCRRLNEDEVFLLSPGVPDALDGRYFGPVSQGLIIAEVTPIWTRERRR